jgi:uncharacterized protein
VSVLYADTSALARAYLADAEDHAELRATLLDGAEPVVTSELTRVELASAVWGAARGGRLRDPVALLSRIESDVGGAGQISLISFRRDVLAAALRLIADHPLRTLDAVHLAVALEDGLAISAPDPLVLVTRDRRQAEAARRVGLPVRGTESWAAISRS